MLGVTPRGPLHLPPAGAHWYAVETIGYPDPGTFTETLALAASWLDDLADEVGVPPERPRVGWLSQGAVMAFALGLGSGRPRPAGLITLSGFMPTVPGFALDITLPLPRCTITHGALDPVISVESSRDAERASRKRGRHHVPRVPAHGALDRPDFLRELPAWLAETVRVAA